jgi:hypothetical protein
MSQISLLYNKREEDGERISLKFSDEAKLT